MADERFSIMDHEILVEEGKGIGGGDQGINTTETNLSPTNKSGSALTKKTLAKFKENQERTGVIYMSRVPPFMKPHKVKSLLSVFGTIGRIYLSMEDAKVSSRRKKYGGNRKKNYTEGWVEFNDKSQAKLAVAALNNTPIGGKKTSFYHDDIWNLKYLPKFKWHHLTERLAYERAVREQRLQAEVSLARRENASYLQNVEKAKMIEGIEEKKRQKNTNQQEHLETPASDQEESKKPKVHRQYRQREVIGPAITSNKTAPKKKKRGTSGTMKTVLGKIL